jgi:hypothetical protein
MAQTLKAFVQRGKEVGVTQTPHRYADGCYVASPSRFERDYVRVDTLEKLIGLWQRGYKIRMSAPDSEHHRSPSLIASGAIDLSFA